MSVITRPSKAAAATAEWLEEGKFRPFKVA